MGVSNRLLCCVCVLVGTVSAVGVTFDVVNGGSSSHTLSAGVNAGAGWSVQQGITVAAGATAHFNFPTTTYELGISCGGTPGPWLDLGMHDNAAQGLSFNVSCDCGSPPCRGAATNCYTYVHVQWTNCAAGHWAQPIGFWTDGHGNIQQDSATFFRVVGPGKTVDYWATNSCTWNGYLFGDAAPAPDSCADITPIVSTNQVEVPPAPGDGNSNPGVIGGGPGGTNPGQGGTIGGNTNATSKDITMQTAALISALANIEYDLRKLDGDLNLGFTNTDNLLSVMPDIDALMRMTTNLLGSANNLESQVLGTNAAEVAVLVQGTNLLSAGNALLSSLRDTNSTLVSVGSATTNALYAGNSLLEGITNLLGRMFTNQLSGFSGLGTNIGGTGTNVFVMNQPTNYLASMGTNLTGIDSNTAGLLNFTTNYAAGMGLQQSNGVWMSTNVASLFGMSNDLFNAVSPSTNGFGSVDVSVGVAGVAAGVSGIGVHPSSDFAMLPLGDGSFVDLKQMLNGEVLESPFASYHSAYSVHWTGMAGIFSAIRLVIMWGIVVGMVLMYSAEMRKAMLEVLHVPAIPVNAGNLLGDAADFVPLLGAGSRIASNAALRIGLAILFVSMLVFIPSILVASAATVFALLPADPNSFIGSFANPVSLFSFYPAIGMIWNLFNSWLPLNESFIFALNWVIAMMGVNSVVVFLGSWKAGFGG